MIHNRFDKVLPFLPVKESKLSARPQWEQPVDSSINQKVYESSGSLRVDLLDAEKIDSNRPDLFRDKIVCCVSSKIRVVSVHRLLAPMFAATRIDDNNIIPCNFLFEFSLKVLGCDSATDRLPGKVSHVGFPYQLVRWNPVYAYPVLDEVSGGVEMGASM